jgi:hypothetical protein
MSKSSQRLQGLEISSLLDKPTRLQCRGYYISKQGRPLGSQAHRFGAIVNLSHDDNRRESGLPESNICETAREQGLRIPEKF